MKIREIASGLRFPEGPVWMDDGSILLVEVAAGTLTRIRQDGSRHVVADLGGGPNGAALGPDGAAYVCNNGGIAWFTSKGFLRPGNQSEDYSGGRIERVDLETGRVERVYEEVQGGPLRGPNDLVFDAGGGFYFTDIGKSRAHESDHGGIYFGHADGRPAQTVAYPLLTPNGIALSPDDNTLYYAETVGARLWAFDLDGPGRPRKAEFPSPQGARLLAASPSGRYQRFDSMAVDALGNLYVASLYDPAILVISPDGVLRGRIDFADYLPTNLCFGGADLRTLYVTLSGTGKLVAVDDWPVPGLRLHPRA
jgi:gluconolactonase